MIRNDPILRPEMQNFLLIFPQWLRLPSPSWTRCFVADVGGHHAVVHSFNSDCGSGVDEGSANEIDIVLVYDTVQQPHLKAARRQVEKGRLCVTEYLEVLS